MGIDSLSTWPVEKAATPPRIGTSQRPLPSFKQIIFLGLLVITAAVKSYSYLKHDDAPGARVADLCPAQVAIAPVSRPDITEKNVNDLFKSAAFRNLSVERLSGAVQIPTQNYDDMGLLGEDSRWDVFYDLQKYFKKTFPLLHEKLELDVVNEHGLVYTWRGTDSSLKPILLTGHQDEVPVAEDTLDEWTYGPFSGHFDGVYINGRGSHDCKNNVVGILSAITALLEVNFEPRRTVVLGFGFDEEASKYYGAAQIGKHLEKVWGQDGFAIIVDEGQIGVMKKFGRTYGIPQASEKGYLDIKLKVHVPGGHSSAPPAHTSIGIISEAITKIEDAQSGNFPSQLTPKNPLYYLLQCAAEDPASDISEPLRKALKDPNGNERVIELLADDPSSALLHTTEAVTIFKSGSKINALPAYAEVSINHRVATEQGVTSVKQALINTVQPIAEKHGLKFITRHESDNTTTELPEYAMSLSWMMELEPSPVSSHHSDSWKYLSGVIKHVFDEEDDDVIVSPMIAQGNTDTRFFWNLSSQIYRFGPLRQWHDQGWGNIHDVNERVALDGHLEGILFYHEFIRVFDEVDLED